MNLIKSYIVYNVSGTVGGNTVITDGVTVQGDGSVSNPIAVIAGVYDPAGSASTAQAAAIAAAATDATTKANAAVVTANAYTDSGLATKQNTLGYTPENAANKENTTIDTSTTKYPTVNLLKTGLDLRQLLINSATAITNAATMDITAIKNTLSTSSATRTFTISYTGDDIILEVTLSATASTFTFPATSLCVSEGIASGDNTCALSGVSGDKYIIAIKKIGSAYYVVCKNFGQ